MMASAYTVNGAVSGFGPLVVSTFGWPSLDPILLQFPLGRICLIDILWLALSSFPEHSHSTPHPQLSPCHCRLCHDLEVRLDASCAYARC